MTNSIINTIDSLLSRLDKVRQTGPDRWIACCPAHPDKTPSLAIRELDDGRTLIHCFSGCEPSEILAAAGLEFSDLFPTKPIADHHAKPERRPFPALDVLKCLAFEATIVLCAATNLLNQGDLALSPDDFQRLTLAHERIGSALSLAEGDRRYV